MSVILDEIPKCSIDDRKIQARVLGVITVISEVSQCFFLSKSNLDSTIVDSGCKRKVFGWRIFLDFPSVISF